MNIFSFVGNCQVLCACTSGLKINLLIVLLQAEKGWGWGKVGAEGTVTSTGEKLLGVESLAL